MAKPSRVPAEASHDDRELAGQPGRVAPARSLVRSGRSLTVVPV
jgi:hypothetical protein